MAEMNECEGKRKCRAPDRSLPFYKKAKWSAREKKSLAYGLEHYGFRDTKKLAAEVKTRTEQEVMSFMERWTDRVYKKDCAAYGCSVPVAQLFCPRLGKELLSKDSKQFPPIAVWKKIVSDVIQKRFRNQDYSTGILVELFKKFAEEEDEELQCRDMPSLKEIYNYLAEALSGNVPPLLSKTSSATLLMLFRDVKHFIDTHDLKDEKEFVQNFVGPHRFQPFRMKSEESNCGDGMQHDSDSNEPETTNSSAVADAHGLSSTVETDVACCGSSAKENSSHKSADGGKKSTTNSNGGTACSSSCTRASCGAATVEDITCDSQTDTASAIVGTSSHSNTAVTTETGSQPEPEVFIKTECHSPDSEPDEIFHGPTINIPSSIFDLLVLHSKVKENINPMVVPVYMLLSEQELIKKYFDNIPV